MNGGDINNNLRCVGSKLSCLTVWQGLVYCLLILTWECWTNCWRNNSVSLIATLIRSPNGSHKMPQLQTTFVWVKRDSLSPWPLAAANKNLKKPRDHMIQDSGLQILVQWSKDSDGAQVQVTLFQQAFLQPIRRCSSIFIGHSKSTIQTGLQLIVVILFILQ